MKKLTLSILAFLLISAGAYSQCFSPVWSEPSLDSMLIYVSLASHNGSNLQVGDEIGVFDGTSCVGAGVLTQELTGAPVYLVIEVSRDNPLTVDVDGFINGNTISYRFCSGGEEVNPAVIPTYITNGPNFAINDSCVVELRAVNTAPVITSAPDTVATEDILYSSAITALDIDGDSLIYSAPLLPAWTSFNDITHILSGTPGNTDVGFHDVTLRVFDGTATVDTSFSIRVANVNDAPTISAVPDTMALEDVLYSSSIAALDIDGDSLIYSAPLLPAWLSFNDITQVLSGTPLNEDVGDHDVTLRVFDGTVNVDTSFVIHVENANDAPTISTVPDTMALEDALYTSSISAVDMDGDSLIYSAPLLPAWLSFNDTTQVLSGMPLNEDVGDHDVTLRVFDGTVNVDTSFVIHVENTNDIPTITAVPDTVATEDILYSSAIAAVDIDDDSLIYSATLLPAWLSFSETTQVLSGTPDNDDVGDHDVTLRIFDGTVNVDTSFVIHVINVNDAPSFTILPDTVAMEDSLFSSTFTAEDPDGDTLTYSVPLLPAWLNFNDTTNTLSGTPVNDDVGAHPITLRINDGTVNTDSAFLIHVLNVNDPPTFTSTEDTTATQDISYTYTPTAEDIDIGDTLSFSAPVLPIWLSFDTVTHILSGTPGNDYVGDNSVVLVVNDGTENVIQDFVIDVENVNDPPTVTSDPVTEARPGVAYLYTVTAIDIDGDELTFTAIVLPGWLVFNATTHTLAATPGEEDIGDQFVTIRVSDGSLYTDHTYIITVDDGNHAPTFTSDPATTVEVGAAYVYTITAQDIDGDLLTYTAPQLPSWLTFYPETHVVSGVPRSGDLGRHDIILRVSDGIVSSDQVFPIFVEAVNTAPTFISVPVTSVEAGELYVYHAEAEDADGDDLDYAALTLPSWLSFDVNTHNLFGTPTNDDAGDHNVSLRVSDGKGAENQHFVITVDFVYGIGELAREEGILIYPNPSNGHFFINLSKELETEVSLEIIDPLGRILQQEEFPPYFLIREEFNLHNSSPGMYLIRIYDKTSQLIRKLIVN